MKKIIILLILLVLPLASFATDYNAKIDSYMNKLSDKYITDDGNLDTEERLITLLEKKLSAIDQIFQIYGDKEYFTSYEPIFTYFQIKIDEKIDEVKIIIQNEEGDESVKSDPAASDGAGVGGVKGEDEEVENDEDNKGGNTCISEIPDLNFNNYPEVITIGGPVVLNKRTLSTSYAAVDIRKLYYANNNTLGGNTPDGDTDYLFQCFSLVVDGDIIGNYYMSDGKVKIILDEPISIGKYSEKEVYLVGKLRSYYNIRNTFINMTLYGAESYAQANNSEFRLTDLRWGDETTKLDSQTSDDIKYVKKSKPLLVSKSVQTGFSNGKNKIYGFTITPEGEEVYLGKIKLQVNGKIGGNPLSSYNSIGLTAGGELALSNVRVSLDGTWLEYNDYSISYGENSITITIDDIKISETSDINIYADASNIISDDIIVVSLEKDYNYSSGPLYGVNSNFVRSDHFKKLHSAESSDWYNSYGLDFSSMGAYTLER